MVKGEGEGKGEAEGEAEAEAEAEFEFEFDSSIPHTMEHKYDDNGCHDDHSCDHKYLGYDHYW